MNTFATQLVSLTNPASFAAEQYQNLRLKIERLRQTRDLRVIAVTSPGAADGKTVTSINLAGALARGAAARVLLVDADLRRPQVADHLHIPQGAAGFADLVVSARASLGEAVRPLDGFNVDVLPAGVVAGPIHDVFRSARLPQLLSEARARYDYVVLDTPPLVPVVDSVLLSRVVDGVLVVVAANKTPRRLLEEGLNALDSAKVLGLVFNSDVRPLYGYDNNYRRYFSRAH
ncbi:MAG: polysaccharide biosynthesis tyrosine autokinase [Acidobacteria bacterium]|nr:MAG: polysaccharide biosynthesis tyrosine autokinase [Acidobacteriota bacterium]